MPMPTQDELMKQLDNEIIADSGARAGSSRCPQRHLAAFTSEELPQVQQQLVGHFQSKEASEIESLRLVQSQIQLCESEGWDTRAMRRLEKKHQKKVVFYQKARAAIEAGYVIVPNFRCEAFAVRTDRLAPARKISEKRWKAQTTERRTLPAGEGAYVAATQETAKENFGSEETPEIVFVPEAFQEIDFPLAVAHPEVIAKTAEAMRLKVFDLVAVVDDNRDPFVVGVIRGPNDAEFTPQRLTFMLAWYLDVERLP